MHGRVWIPLFVFVWLFPLLTPPVPGMQPVQAAAQDRTPTAELPPTPTPKKQRSVPKGRGAKPRSGSAHVGHSTPRRLSQPLPGEKSSRNPTVRRQAAESALLRRLAAAGLLRGPMAGESRVLDSWRIRLVDGDTFLYDSERIRIRGYDAPERSQPGGFDATQRLEALLHEGEVRMYPHGLDVYGRTLADVYVAERNVADVMIAEGYTKKR